METKASTKRIGIVIILLMSVVSFIVSMSTLYAEPNQENKTNTIDIRFIIDMSQDMRKFDPQNSRVRTLQKIIKSLPDNAISGVWTYGKYVNMLVPLGAATEQWKKQAVYNLDTISAYGNFRNIGTAIEKATYGWDKKASYNKYIVVLTSGDLRVSNSKVKNAQSQLQLLTGTLAKLKKGGIKVHTISLGEHADDRLLKVLANSTQGNWYKIDSVKTLPSVIGHMYNIIAAKNHIVEPKDNYAYQQKQSSVFRAKVSNAKATKQIIAKNITKTVGANSVEKVTEHKLTGKKLAVDKTKDNYNSRYANSSDLHKKFHTDSYNQPNKLKTIEKEKKLNLKYKNRDEMDFNWPAT